MDASDLIDSSLPEQVPDPVAALLRRHASAAATVAEPETDDAAAGVETLLGFCVGGLYLACAFDEVLEVAEVPELYPLPHAPHWLRGVANLHGKSVPVTDLHALLDLEAQSSKRWLLLTGSADEPFGVLVESLPDTLVVDQGMRLSGGEAALNPRLRDHCVAVYHATDQIWILVELKHLLRVPEFL